MNTTIDIEKEEAAQEIKRLSKLVGRSTDFVAAMWAIQSLINCYERDFETKFDYEK